jgi:hypothetical protein
LVMIWCKAPGASIQDWRGMNIQCQIRDGLESLNNKSRLTGPALIPVHFKMGAAQKEIDKGESNGANSTENYHCRYCCDCQLDHENDHGGKWHFDVGDHDFGICF